MEVEIGYHNEFGRQLKRLSKKYPSMKQDFQKFLNSIEDNPLQGSDLGGNVRKVRMAIQSKGKGKSGGARVITYSLIQQEDKLLVTLLTIYDKGEMGTVSDSFIRSLVKSI